MKTTCDQCGREFDATGCRGRTPRFCSAACKQKAYRDRRKRNALPAVLTECDRWVRADGKRPILRDGSPASSTNPATWASYSEVMRSTAGDGYGVMLGGGIGCYDLDHCIVDGALQSWAAGVLDSIPEPVLFAEVSVSGHGLHVFIEAPEGPGFRHGNVERYTRARFIRVTGKSVDLEELASA